MIKLLLSIRMVTAILYFKCRLIFSIVSIINWEVFTVEDAYLLPDFHGRGELARRWLIVLFAVLEWRGFLYFKFSVIVIMFIHWGEKSSCTLWEELSHVNCCCKFLEILLLLLSRHHIRLIHIGISWFFLFGAFLVEIEAEFIALACILQN